MKSIKLFICCFAALSFLFTGTSTAQEFEPQYIGGYPTKETAEAMFEEYDYQAAVQFYVWGYTSPIWYTP